MRHLMSSAMADNIIRSTIEDIPVLGIIDAHELADAVVDLVIAMLMRDPAMPQRTYSEWWARLANVRAHIVARLHHRIGDHADIEDVLRALAWAGVLPEVFQ
jgi:hypothetical protein